MTFLEEKYKKKQAAHKEPMQGMYGLEATHPQYPQMVQVQGEEQHSRFKQAPSSLRQTTLQCDK